MPHQEAFTLIAEIEDGRVDPLKQRLRSLRGESGGWNILPFPAMDRLHFAQFTVFEASKDLQGSPLQPRLVLLTTVDAPLAEHLEDLSTIRGEGMDAVFSHCKAYPAEAERSPATRRRFLEAHSIRAEAVHINRRGRTVQQIRQEEFLRRELNAYVDSHDLRGLAALTVRDQMVDFVRGRNDLDWALRAPDPCSLSWRVKEWLHLVSRLLLLILLTPLLLIGLPLFLWRLRYHEQRDQPDTSVAPAAAVRAIRDEEDYWAQNQVVAVGCLKAGFFRDMTTRGVMAVTDFSTRHIYNRGTLSGLNTIHFARWVRFDGGRRMFFASVYDGTVESYMNDFIDKAAWGLNAIFSNGDGFPPTVYMVGRGIADEKAYKRFLPTRLAQTCVWYSAYPHLTTKNIANNEALRRGFSTPMSEPQARSWLKRFGSGHQLPESGWAARLIDGLPWDRICRNWR